MTNWTPDSKSSTNFSDSPGRTGSRTLSVGSPIGLLLSLTHAEAGTVTFTQFDTDYTPSSPPSTGWS